MTKTIDPIDRHVGKMLRSLRLAGGFSQTELGDMIGVQFQQIQKYETGANRIAASRLKMAADALGAPISAFFEGLDHTAKSRAISAVLADPVALSIAAAIHAMPPAMRQSVNTILAAMTAALPTSAA
jgi:transcriptional regulator with XRE-family HTH domain